MTHLMGHAIAYGQYKLRRDQGRITFGYFKHTKKIGTTVLVDVEGGTDLVPITIFDAEKISVIEFAKRCNERVVKAKNKQDSSHNKQTASANFLPACLIQPIMHWVSYINVGLNIEIPGMAKKDNIGHAVLTNVGTLKMQQAFAPLCPPMRGLGLCCAGRIRQEPMMIDGKPQIQDMICLTFTGDHRYGDAALLVPLQRVIKGYMEDPANFNHLDYKANVHYSETDAPDAMKK